MSVVQKEFGRLSDSRMAYVYEIKNKKGFCVEVTNYGVNIISIYTWNKFGQLQDVALGYDTLEEYCDNHMMFGSTVGRNVNRISNAKFVLDGVEYHVAQNRGKHNIHSDKEHGFHKVLWDAEIIAENAVKFSYLSPDGDQGFPGEVKISIVYTVTEADGLMISYYGVSDKKTILNVTNHNYFNLGGHKSGIIDDTEVTILADAYTPVDEDTIPTGEIKSVEGTKMDFRQPKMIGTEAYDHNFVIRDQHCGIRKMANAVDKAKGIGMEVYSDLPGLQFYTGNTMQTIIGKDGAHYGPRCGFCMEPHYYPNSINTEGFEKPVFEAGQVYQTTTIYQFYVTEE